MKVSPSAAGPESLGDYFQKVHWNPPENGLVLVHPTSGSSSQIAWIIFSKMFILQQNIYSLKKLGSHPLTLGGLQGLPPPPAYFVCQNAQPFKG